MPRLRFDRGRPRRSTPQTGVRRSPLSSRSPFGARPSRRAQSAASTSRAREQAVVPTPESDGTFNAARAATRPRHAKTHRPPTAPSPSRLVQRLAMPTARRSPPHQRAARVSKRSSQRRGSSGTGRRRRAASFPKGAGRGSRHAFGCEPATPRRTPPFAGPRRVGKLRGDVARHPGTHHQTVRQDARRR